MDVSEPVDEKAIEKFLLRAELPSARTRWHFWIWLLIGGQIFSVLAIGWYAWPPAVSTIAIDGIKVRGSDKFLTQIESAIKLLRDKSPEEYAVVTRNVARIDEARRSGMQADADPPTMYLHETTSDYSLTWCAGAIAHEAYHSKLYQESLRLHGQPVPGDSWRGQAREYECIQFQLRVMNNIGAPTGEVQYLSGLDGSHFDLDGDGQETWMDYWKRNW